MIHYSRYRGTAVWYIAAIVLRSDDVASTWAS